MRSDRINKHEEDELNARKRMTMKERGERHRANNPNDIPLSPPIKWDDEPPVAKPIAQVTPKVVTVIDDKFFDRRNNPISIPIKATVFAGCQTTRTLIKETNTLIVTHTRSWKEEEVYVPKKKVPKPHSSQPLTELTVAQLKQLCKGNGLKVGGRKADLIDRLSDYNATQGGEEE